MIELNLNIFLSESWLSEWSNFRIYTEKYILPASGHVNWSKIYKIFVMGKNIKLVTGYATWSKILKIFVMEKYFFFNLILKVYKFRTVQKL